VFDLQAYLDESGDRRFLGLTAVVAPIDRWIGLETTWSESLRLSWGNPREFHAEWCRHGNKAYRGWPGNERLRLRDQLVEVIYAAKVLAIGIAVDLEAFKKVRAARPVLRKTYAHPYYLAFGAILTGLALTQGLLNVFPHLPDATLGDFAEAVEVARAAAKEHGRDFRLGIIADRNDQRRGRLIEVFNYFKDRPPRGCPLGGLDFGDSEEFPGIQAADLVGYEVRLFLCDTVFGTGRRDAEKWPSALPRLIEPDRPWGVHVLYLDEERLNATADSFEAQWRGDPSSLFAARQVDWSLAAWLGATRSHA